MRLAFGLLLFALGAAMNCETSAQEMKTSDNAAIVQGDNQFAVDLYAQLDRERPVRTSFSRPPASRWHWSWPMASAHYWLSGK
jgi:hypothetical protein